MDSVDQNLSARKIEANRKNARRSTGPRSPSGKKAVRLNALKHGLLAQDLIISGREKPAKFQKLHDRLRVSLQPEGILEDLLVEKIAVSVWRSRRVLRTEAEEIAKECSAIEECRQLEEFGTLSTDVAEGKRVAADLPSTEASKRILRYDRALELQFYRALRSLIQLQKRRRAGPVGEVEEGEFDDE